MEDEKFNLIIDESVHSETPETSQQKPFTTQWKGTLVPMNDHSDKGAVLYTDIESGRDFRFILHRKNHQKADNYACARCKSRKKYIAGEYFLEDPAKLDHICYLGAEELKRVRESLDKQKAAELLKERQQKTNDPPLDLARIQHVTAAYPLNAIASLFEEQSTAPELGSPTSGDEDIDGDIIPSTSLLDSVFNNTIKTELEVQKSDAELKEPVIKRPRSDSFGVLPSPIPDDSSTFYISLTRALSGLRPETRCKAENEILRFVYSNLYEKYGV